MRDVLDRFGVTPGFRRAIEVQIAHAAGDALIAIALAGTLFFDVTPGEARDRVGLYLLITMTPFAIIAPVLGPLLDRWRGSYRLALAVAAAGRCVLALYMATRTDRLLLYPLAFGLLVLSRAHAVSRAGYVPHVLPDGRSLVWANARLAIASVAGSVIGAVPGLALQRLGPGWTLRAAAVVFLGGAVLALGLPSGPGGARRREIPAGKTKSLLEPVLLSGGMVAATARGALGFLVFMLAFALRADGHGPRAFGAVLVAAAFGGLVGSVAAPVLRRVVAERALLYLSVGAMGVVAFVMSSSFGVPAAAVVAGTTALAATTARLAFDALVQHRAPDEIRGRTFARYETIFQLCWVLGAGAATAIPFGGTWGLRVMALICVVGAALSVTGAAARDARAQEG